MDFETIRTLFVHKGYQQNKKDISEITFLTIFFINLES